LALDPSFAPAWAWLAVDLQNLSTFANTAAGVSEAQSRAEAAAERAVDLAPDLAESHAARALARASVFDWSGEQAELERALALNPGDAATRLEYAFLLATLGRLRESVVNARKAAEIDPLWSRTWNRLGRFYNATGELDLAESALKRALQISPDYFSVPYHLGTTYLLQRNPTAALAAFEQANPEANRLIGVAMARHDLGHRKDSQLGLETAAARHSQAWAFQIAEGYAWCGERDRAFEWLERAYLQRDAGMSMLKFTPLLRSLRGDPRYAALLRKLNLPLD
jgi:tetratricopeptide (TPR) repeat protein